MRAQFFRYMRALFSRQTLAIIVRSLVILSMSFAAAFGFLAAMQNPGANYDPHMFAIGAAALFGAACGAIGLLFSRSQALKQELRAANARADELADLNWELKESEERAKSFLAAQGDVIVRRDGDGCITYVNDPYCALAGRSRSELIDTDFAPATIEQGATRRRAGRHPYLRSENRDAGRRSAGSPGGRCWYAPARAPAPSCRASAATSPTACWPSGRSPMRAIRLRPPTAPSHASWPWCRMRCARRSMASSAWPISWPTPR